MADCGNVDTAAILKEILDMQSEGEGEHTDIK